jgi:hypothetical protein
VVAAAQLERVEVELRGELVEQALEPERPLDEARRTKRGHRRRVRLRAVLDRLDVVAGVEHLHRARGSGQPAVPAERADVLALQRGDRPVRARADGQPLDRRVAVAGVEVLLAPGQRALHGPARAARELDGDEREVAGVGLGAEATAHVLTDDANPVRRQVEALRQAVPRPPDPLRRGVDGELVALPHAQRLVRLERVVEEARRAVLGLDDHVRLGQPALDVAARERPRLAVERSAPDRLLRVDERVELLPFDLDQRERLVRLLGRLGRERRHRRAVVAGLVHEHVGVARDERGAHTRRLQRTRDVDPVSARVRVWAAEDGRVERAREREVGRVERLAARLRRPIDPLRRPADGRQRSLGPRLERVLLDDDPLLGPAPLDLLLRPDQSRHVRIASSILG